MPEETRYLDGLDEIIYTETFNIYNDNLRISGIMKAQELTAVSFDFIFQKGNEPAWPLDIQIVPFPEGGSEIKINNKFRNPLGASTSEKLRVMHDENKEIYLSIFGQAVGGGKCLHVTINFYSRNVLK